MKQFVEKINGMEFSENGKGQMKQNERNDLRNATIDALVDGLTEMLGFEVYRTVDGVGIELPNENFGSIPIIVGVTIKDLSYDIMEANAEYLDKEIDKVAKAKEKEAEKARKIAEQEVNKLARANKKNSK